MVEGGITSEGHTLIVILMGVVGAGKTTVGRLLATQLGWQFADADDFHPPSNKEKIHRGIPLTDEDRKPWLEGLRSAITRWINENRNVVLACSALKQAYREKLEVAPEVRFIYLKGSADFIAARLHNRHGHFADAKILASQFANLEEPNSAITVDIARSPEEIVSEIRQKLSLA